MEKMQYAHRVSSSGFTLVEVLVYAIIFSISAVFLVGILIAVTRTQLSQTSVNEVNQQLSFVTNTIQRLVRDASVIENDAGVSSSTLVLRMASSTADPTRIYSSSSVLYLAEGTAVPVALTNEKVSVSNFSINKLQNEGGFAIVQIDLTIEYNTTNPQLESARTWRSAVSRISAATFDYSVVPGTNNIYDLGNASYKWKDAYFSGGVAIGASSIPAGYQLILSANDLALQGAGKGVVLKSSGGSCFRVGVSDSGGIATTSVTCP